MSHPPHPPAAAPGQARADDLHPGSAVLTGLRADEAAARLQQCGPNVLADAPRTSMLTLFARQFRNVLVVILAVAAGLALLVGDVKDAAVVGVVLVLNATLGFVQERRAEQGIEALRAMLSPRARVRRDGRPHDVDASEVVPGDLLLVEAGDRVAADGVLVVGSGVAVDESALTGESVPVDKTPAEPEEGPEPVSALLRMNTVVTRGRGEVLVTATGMDTEIGRLAGLIQKAPRPATPLQRQLGALGRRLAAVAGVAVSAVFGLSLARGDGLVAASMDAIALAVAAIPEGLPAVVTVTLALGTARMAKRRAIVRRLSSVETLGSATVVCTDKTGTLTRNQMTARRVWRGGADLVVTGEGYAAAGEVQRAGRGPAVDLTTVGEAFALCADATVAGGAVVGDPTEAALLVLAGKAGVDVDVVRARNPRVAELPFDAATKLMATVHPDGDGLLLVVKGAPDVVLARCAELAGVDGATRLTGTHRAQVDGVLGDMGAEGLRVLAVATRRLAPGTGLDHVGALLDGLRLEALVGIVDPPRAEAAAAVATCRTAGIRVMMITGDHASTAGAIARAVGIRGEVLTGADLDGLDDEALARRLDEVGVVARVTPAHKLRIVEALQHNGHVVAMTGDGVNDAPALKGADIGVAMGQAGTDVSKDAADVVLADDNFATIVHAVEAGRSIYDNIVSFVRFQLATNIGAITAILCARLLGLPAPFTPLQILWVNLIMDGPPAMALGIDPPKPGVMRQPPRDPRAAILHGRRLVPLLLAGAVMAAGTIAAYLWGRATGGTALATTMAFTTFVLFQFFNALNARVEHGTVFSAHTLRNRRLWQALGAVLLLQIAAVHVGFAQRVFDTVPLGLAQWGLAAAIASSVVVVEELRKRTTAGLRNRRTAPGPGPGSARGHA